MTIYYVDGEYVDAAEAVLPLTDMAILRGYAVFDFLRTYNGRPFHLGEHLLRLSNSAALLQISCPWSPGDIKNIVEELLQRNSFREVNIRLLITGGDSDDSITPMDNPRLVVMAGQVTPFPAHWYRDGAKIITSEVTRHVPGSKSTNYIQAIMSLKQARQVGAVESIYVNEKNHLLEGTTSNLFVVRGNTVLTPEEGILAGITRDVVLHLAEKEFLVEKTVISRDGLKEYTEAFLTSSNKEVLPVVQVDDTILSKGPGPVTSRIMKLFRHYTDSWR